MEFDCRYSAEGEPKYVNVNVHFAKLISIVCIIQMDVHIAGSGSTINMSFCVSVIQFIKNSLM